MKVDWHPRARIGKDQISDYIRERFGARHVNKFQQSVERTLKMIMRYPEIGTIDPLFADRPRTYRSVIIDGLSKMVYFVEGDIIYIAAFWDCRREPKALVEQTRGVES